MSNTNPTNNRGCIQVHRNCQQFLFNLWHPSCYSCYRLGNKSCIDIKSVRIIDFVTPRVIVFTNSFEFCLLRWQLINNEHPVFGGVRVAHVFGGVPVAQGFGGVRVALVFGGVRVAHVCGGVRVAHVFSFLYCAGLFVVFYLLVICVYLFCFNFGFF